MLGWWMVHTTVRPVFTVLRTHLMTMAAARASSPAFKAKDGSVTQGPQRWQCCAGKTVQITLCPHDACSEGQQLQPLLTWGWLVHENNGWVSNQLYCNGEALPLLDRQTSHPRHTHQGVRQGFQLHQLHDLNHKGVNGGHLYVFGETQPGTEDEGLNYSQLQQSKTCLDLWGNSTHALPKQAAEIGIIRHGWRYQALSRSGSACLTPYILKHNISSTVQANLLTATLFTRHTCKQKSVCLAKHQQCVCHPRTKSIIACNDTGQGKEAEAEAGEKGR